MTQMVKQPIQSIYADLSHVTNDICEDGFTAIIRYEDGLTAVIEVGTGNYIGLPRWYMLGEKGTARIDNQEADGKIIRKNHEGNGGETQEIPLPAQKSDIREFYQNVMAAIEGNQKPFVTHEEMMRVMMLMEAVIESGQNNVVITDFEDRCLKKAMSLSEDS